MVKMGGLECVITGIMDEFKTFFQRHNISREIFTGLVVFSSFLVAIVCVTPVIIAREFSNEEKIGPTISYYII